jgi:hypothetical protein
MTPFDTGSKTLDNALSTVAAPALRFIETGIHEESWTVDDPDEHEGVWARGAISPHQTSRVVREVAKELKRPFVAMYAVRQRWQYRSRYQPGTVHHSSTKPGSYYKDIQKLPQPVFSHGHIHVPKRQYLLPLVRTLILATVSQQMPSWRQLNDAEHKKPDVLNHSLATIWRFRIYNEEMWGDYRASMDRPEMRAARRLPPL